MTGKTITGDATVVICYYSGEVKEQYNYAIHVFRSSLSMYSIGTVCVWPCMAIHVQCIYVCIYLISFQKQAKLIFSCL